MKTQNIKTQKMKTQNIKTQNIKTKKNKNMATVEETKKRLEKINNLFDFQEEFYWQHPETLEMFPDFELVFWNGENYTSNQATKTFDRNGNCTNIFIKCSDGFIEYPF